MSWKVKCEMWKLKGFTFDSINSNRSREASPRFCGFVISRLLRVADLDAHWICHIDRMGDISLWFCEIHWQCLFLASHAVQTTSAQRVTNCYKHCRTSFTAYRDDRFAKKESWVTAILLHKKALVVPVGTTNAGAFGLLRPAATSSMNRGGLKSFDSTILVLLCLTPHRFAELP